jgi:hypothetical protein
MPQGKNGRSIQRSNCALRAQVVYKVRFSKLSVTSKPLTKVCYGQAKREFCFITSGLEEIGCYQLESCAQ